MNSARRSFAIAQTIYTLSSLSVQSVRPSNRCVIVLSTKCKMFSSFWGRPCVTLFHLLLHLDNTNEMPIETILSPQRKKKLECNRLERLMTWMEFGNYKSFTLHSRNRMSKTLFSNCVLCVALFVDKEFDSDACASRGEVRWATRTAKRWIMRNARGDVWWHTHIHGFQIGDFDSNEFIRNGSRCVAFRNNNNNNKLNVGHATSSYRSHCASAIFASTAHSRKRRAHTNQITYVFTAEKYLFQFSRVYWNSDAKFIRSGICVCFFLRRFVVRSLQKQTPPNLCDSFTHSRAHFASFIVVFSVCGAECGLCSINSFLNEFSISVEIRNN